MEDFYQVKILQDKNKGHGTKTLPLFSRLFTELTTLHACTTEKLTVLLFGHALTTLLNDRTHGVYPQFIRAYITCR